MQDVASVNAATLGGKDAIETLGFYATDDHRVSINADYTNPEKMNATYDRGAASGYHPTRGDKTGTQAVTYHEMGHAVTGVAAQKMGESDFDAASKRIVDNAYKASGGKGGTKKWAGGISGYAQESNAECIAEAVCDYYCNGSRARSESRAIMSELRRVFNGG